MRITTEKKKKVYKCEFLKRTVFFPFALRQKLKKETGLPKGST